jgi:hypothetical protein
MLDSFNDELRKLLLLQDDFWRQKAKIKWLKEGDLNKKFFQATVANKRNQTKISTIKNCDGVRVSSPYRIAQAGVSFYTR